MFDIKALLGGGVGTGSQCVVYAESRPRMQHMHTGQGGLTSDPGHRKGALLSVQHLSGLASAACQRSVVACKQPLAAERSGSDLVWALSVCETPISGAACRAHVMVA